MNSKVKKINNLVRIMAEQTNHRLISLWLKSYEEAATKEKWIIERAYNPVLVIEYAESAMPSEARLELLYPIMVELCENGLRGANWVELEKKLVDNCQAELVHLSQEIARRTPHRPATKMDLWIINVAAELIDELKQD